MPYFTAYDVLSDPEKRRQYDQFGTTGQGQQFHKPFDFDAFFGRGSGKNSFFDFNFDDLFKDDMFGFGEQGKFSRLVAGVVSPSPTN